KSPSAFRAKRWCSQASRRYHFPRGRPYSHAPGRLSGPPGVRHVHPCRRGASTPARCRLRRGGTRRRDLGGELKRKVVLALALFLAVATSPARAVAPPDSVGQWLAPFLGPVIGTHGVLLPPRKGLYYHYPQSWPGSESAIYDPASSTFAYMPLQRNLFCSGYAYLPDGNVLVVGGDVQPPVCPSNGQGVADVHVYYPFTNSWVRTN